MHLCLRESSTLQQEVEQMKGNTEMQTKELDRLADWLTAQGMSAEKVLECIKYIAGKSAPERKNG